LHKFCWISLKIKIELVVGFSGGFLHQYAPKCIYLQSFARRSNFV